MLQVARQVATDAMRLEVESHIEDCAACEEECARWKLVGMVKRYLPPRLGPSAERRIIDGLVSAGTPGLVAVAAPVSPRPRSLSVARWSAITVSAAAFVFLGLFAVHLVFGPRGSTEMVREGEVVDAVAPGSVSFGGARVKYLAGTHMILHPGGRTLALMKGEVDVDVTPGLPGRFRVATAKFTVEVLGTRFFVTPQSVRTVRGRVRVLDLGGREQAVLTAGGAWMVPVAPASPAATIEAAAPEPPPPVVAPEPAPASPSAAPPTVRHVRVTALLSRSRAALARGKARQARGLALRALAADPTERQVASSQLLLADSLLVARRPRAAIEAYRGVVRRYPRAPEAETAQFAVGQLLLERGAAAEAAAAFNDYLTRYPTGRFVRESREHLAQIRSKE
jgi:hypothetical protein